MSLLSPPQAGRAAALRGREPALGHRQQVSDLQQGRVRPLRLLPPPPAVPKGPGGRGQPAAAPRPLPLVRSEQLPGHRERLLSPEEQLTERTGPPAAGLGREECGRKKRSQTRRAGHCWGGAYCGWVEEREMTAAKGGGQRAKRGQRGDGETQPSSTSTTPPAVNQPIMDVTLDESPHPHPPPPTLPDTLPGL